MNDQINIIPVYTDSQLMLVAKMANDIWRRHYIPIIGEAQVNYMLEKFQSVPAIVKQMEEGAHYFILNNQGVAAGYFSYYIKEDSLFLSKIYVLNSMRGRGLGKDAIRFLYSKAMDAGLSLVSLTVNKNNSNSIAAYKKMGFKIIRPLVTDIGSGFVMDDFYMEKELDQARDGSV